MWQPRSKVLDTAPIKGGEERSFPSKVNRTLKEQLTEGYTVLDQRQPPYNATKGLAKKEAFEIPFDAEVETEYGQRSYDHVVADFKKDGEIDDHFPDA